MKIINLKFALFFISISLILFSCTKDDENLTSNETVTPTLKAASTDIKIISCMEVNECNPLNNGSYTLKSSGKPLFDMLILFSSNINYNEQLGKPYIHHNTELTNILNNSDKYIKPLKDKGIKVILSLLGNWDRAGVSNMNEATAKQFALDIKQTLDTYNLDGVFFDDEYSSYITPPPAGFVTPSTSAAGRLLYETKKAIGNKLVFSYIYSRLNGQMPTIDGVMPSQYIDYALSDYFKGPVSSTYYTGMTNTQKAPWSQEFARNYFISTMGSWYNISYQKIVNEGYGAHLIFALDPNRSNFSSRQLSELKNIAKTLKNDELVYNGKVYPTDYK